VILPIGRTAAYEPSVDTGVLVASVKGFVLYTFENEQHDEKDVITPGVSE
jgi:predicted lipoprotein with Yx(FWY)xxD motif